MQGGRKKKNGEIKNYFVVGPAKSRTDPGGGCQKKKKKSNYAYEIRRTFRSLLPRPPVAPSRSSRDNAVAVAHVTAVSSRAAVVEFPRVRQWSRRRPVTYPSPRCPLSATCWRRRCSPAPATTTLLDGCRPDRLAARRCWSRSTATPLPVLLQPHCNDFRWSH